MHGDGASAAKKQQVAKPKYWPVFILLVTAADIAGLILELAWNGGVEDFQDNPFVRSPLPCVVCRVTCRVCPRTLNRGGGKRQWERCRELESQEVGFDHAREEHVGESVVLLGRRIAEDHRKRQQLVRQQRAIIAIITIIVVVLLRRLFDREPVL